MFKCSNAFECGFEKFHKGQINHPKLNQEIKKENILHKMENNLNNRRSAVASLKETLSSQIENRFALQKRPWIPYWQFKNLSLLRKHVHLIETYCKHNFRGKIPPKQKPVVYPGSCWSGGSTSILITSQKATSQTWKSCQRRHRICFPDMSVPTSSLTTMSCKIRHWPYWPPLTLL
jgi:phage gpG-like protein